jgi:hypothetical protein
LIIQMIHMVMCTERNQTSLISLLMFIHIHIYSWHNCTYFSSLLLKLDHIWATKWLAKMLKWRIHLQSSQRKYPWRWRCQASPVKD